jgi:hypothetical protein
MKVNVITLYEGHYHYGVAALINSLLACGFQGKITAYCRDGEPLPPWTRRLPRIADHAFQLPGSLLAFKPTEVKRHFGYHKPFAALQELTADPECEAVVYADPDVLFLAPWKFFEEWLGMGLALCLDVSFPYLSENHPWRKTWKDLLARATGEVSGTTSQYVNSGFFGVARTDLDFLRQWIKVTQKFEEEGGNTTSFDLINRHRAIVGDQDLLATTLMGWRKGVSILGQEGMGFNGDYFILSHHIWTPKPWIRSFIKESLKGERPSPAAGFYLKFSNAPLAPYSAGQLFRKQLGFKFAQLISRLWAR